ncbi:hypothetical protein [Saccharothrix coeruleofusca]|uniref:Uncharacterized protein n=1 Tax=Saccharothrix coeruleofusca TaxID=33919 RepID=A0A918EHE8_9PSEU|nr:hypothetical protein [Saccharothrix coeruleofusca]GGP80979.1 hypothetical protein GCM10010185_63690 [Saccharothrix coeruleofusca]
MSDIKEILGTAFGDEPPLRVDREAIVKSGRRRLAVRSAATGMAVFAAVAAVTVPVLLGGRGGGIGIGGAPSSSAPPLTSTTAGGPSTTLGSTPPSTHYSSAPASADPSGGLEVSATSKPADPNKPRPPKPVTAERAAALTSLVTSSGVLPQGQYTPIPAGQLEMRPTPDGYQLAADVTTATGSGQLRLSLRMERQVGCADSSSIPGLQCWERQVDGKRIIVEDHQLGGDRRLAVTYQHADGTLFQASATDHTQAGPAGPMPLTWEQLAKIATLPGVAF